MAKKLIQLNQNQKNQKTYQQMSNESNLSKNQWPDHGLYHDALRKGIARYVQSYYQERPHQSLNESLINFMPTKTLNIYEKEDITYSLKDRVLTMGNITDTAVTIKCYSKKKGTSTKWSVMEI
ncbi:hypothetical protein [Paenibacillus sp. RC67]|uniref:hypothetical protein n=1 Tax=Paenibacillus sp. RC67 TaxID=3039392 RepID=UPI0024AD90E5|nr:hypothetical protein [Paenibacillus sp. RC67]